MPGGMKPLTRICCVLSIFRSAIKSFVTSSTSGERVILPSVVICSRFVSRKLPLQYLCIQRTPDVVNPTVVFAERVCIHEELRISVWMRTAVNAL